MCQCHLSFWPHVCCTHTETESEPNRCLLSVTLQLDACYWCIPAYAKPGEPSSFSGQVLGMGRNLLASSVQSRHRGFEKRHGYTTSSLALTASTAADLLDLGTWNLTTSIHNPSPFHISLSATQTRHFCAQAHAHYSTSLLPAACRSAYPSCILAASCSCSLPHLRFIMSTLFSLAFPFRPRRPFFTLPMSSCPIHPCQSSFDLPISLPVATCCTDPSAIHPTMLTAHSRGFRLSLKLATSSQLPGNPYPLYIAFDPCFSSSATPAIAWSGSLALALPQSGTRRWRADLCTT